MSFWRAHVTWETFMKELIERLEKEGYVLKSKPSAGKKKVLNLWYDEATGEVVIETE